VEKYTLRITSAFHLFQYSYSVRWYCDERITFYSTYVEAATLNCLTSTADADNLCKNAGAELWILTRSVKPWLRPKWLGSKCRFTDCDTATLRVIVAFVTTLPYSSRKSPAQPVAREQHVTRGDTWKETSFNLSLAKVRQKTQNNFENLWALYVWKHILNC